MGIKEFLGADYTEGRPAMQEDYGVEAVLPPHLHEVLAWII
jgi:hypothetical protein